MADKTNALSALQARNPRFQGGKTTKTVEFEQSFTGANSADGDKIVLASGLSFADRISSIRPNAANVPALTSAADNDLGFFYKNEDGVLKELDADILWDGVSLVSASTNFNLLTGKNAALDHDKNIGQLLGKGIDQEPAGGVFLVLTMNTANTATATVRLAIDVDVATTE